MEASIESSKGWLAWATVAFVLIGLAVFAFVDHRIMFYQPERILIPGLALFFLVVGFSRTAGKKEASGFLVLGAIFLVIEFFSEIVRYINSFNF
ncbi:MAG: hypothetical protein UT34_C0001G0401 [candidate division WS6 bacterium GW2011_GWF2_39_15]|uniref:Uncharacterized protein n=1 Tax=candidate division WS6 bacterium GW2011_GWF2_39_15 TaxID=1619100 RepID=A0A0G0N0J7_9BACT|nr:MAG: hypothetical protein UT34_C0001G0401 [candidate division WS6 bacterium GW2011_GWF2_39_15]